MTDIEHTPTPYVARRGDLGWEIYTQDGQRIGSVLRDLNRSRHTECEANAAFIVRACNSHDELVAALRALLPMAEACHEVPPTRANLARAALAKATEGE